MLFHGIIRYPEAIPKRQPPRPRRDKPWAYFLTFTCYGDRLHGDQRGSVDREHNGFGARFLEVRPLRYAYEAQRMPGAGIQLDAAGRRIVRDAIEEVCRHEQWTLYALHVRATHVHIVVKAEPGPEHVLGKCKAYASRALNKRFGFCAKRWTRHGSTRWLWSPSEVDGTVHYVIRQQGDLMEAYEFVDRWSDVL